MSRLDVHTNDELLASRALAAEPREGLSSAVLVVTSIGSSSLEDTIASGGNRNHESTTDLM